MSKTKKDTFIRRISELRKAIIAENISYGEISELQSLKDYIDKADTLLLEWAGVAEYE